MTSSVALSGRDPPQHARGHFSQAGRARQSARRCRRRSALGRGRGCTGDKEVVPGPGKVLFQAANANLNPWTGDKVDTKNPERGPMLIVAAEKDHTVPYAIANASFKREKHNEGVTEMFEFEGRGHSLCIDHGWRACAATERSQRRAVGRRIRLAGIPATSVSRFANADGSWPRRNRARRTATTPYARPRHGLRFVGGHLDAPDGRLRA